MIILCYESALEYWRIARMRAGEARIYKPDKAFPLQEKHDFALCRAKPPLIAPSSKEVIANNSLHLTEPIHILHGNETASRAKDGIKLHLYTGCTPYGSFVRINEKLAVCSPEFCLYQMAGRLSLVKLIELAYEFCGTYSMPANTLQAEQQSGAVFKRLPLTNKKALISFAHKMHGVRGKRQIIRAQRYTLELSASPMETKLALLLSLPYKLGGYGLPCPEMNGRIRSLKKSRQGMKKNFFCDLYWPHYNLAVEYDSNLHHTGPKHITADSKRRNEILSLGVLVITVTSNHLNTIGEFREVASQIATRLGKRLRYKEPDFSRAHLSLQRELFG